MQTTQKTKNKKRKQSIQVMAEELNREFSREETQSQLPKILRESDHN